MGGKFHLKLRLYVQLMAYVDTFPDIGVLHGMRRHTRKDLYQLHVLLPRINRELYVEAYGVWTVLDLRRVVLKDENIDMWDIWHYSGRQLDDSMLVSEIWAVNHEIWAVNQGIPSRSTSSAASELAVARVSANLVWGSCGIDCT